jgi:hypothetical protein
MDSITTRERCKIPSAHHIDDMKNLANKKVLSVMFILYLSLLSGASYGEEQQEKPRISSMVGVNVEVSATNNRNIVNVGLWLAEQGLLTHVGLYDIKPKNESSIFGVDIGMGYCNTGYYIWPFAEIGVKVGVGTGISNLQAELYPKIGINIPITYQMSVYVGYLYSFSTEGRRKDYSAASIGFVWAIL